MKYGMFESRVELRKLPERLFGIVCEDTEIGNPIKIYDSKEEALTELKKYHSDITKTVGYAGNKFYDCIIYFVAECEKINMDGNEIDYTIWLTETVLKPHRWNVRLTCHLRSLRLMEKSSKAVSLRVIINH